MARGSGERARRYRAIFVERYGITYGDARALSRSLYGSAGSPARAAKTVASTQQGIRLIEAGGRYAEVAQRAMAHRGLAANAMNDVRYGVYDVATAEPVYGLAAGTLRTQFPSAVDARGRVTRADREPVIMQVLSMERGATYVATRGSRARSVLAQHSAAVDHFLRTGDTSRLDGLAGRRVGGVTLETDPAVIEALAAFGQLPQGPYPQARGLAA
jgi:hypothetical protein